ncbi:PucR family transcriptional regulator [Clostridium polynesiense]|uniref:PucR family transcriptional regulator n=1 Tax=Clostridium polynesiense TaxID=1325933 RepID=UPI000591520C|nr:helix-turn-helix domain-containing protein [Clostridium polynesiense]
MYDFHGFLEELSTESGIRFKLISDEGIEIFNSLGEYKESQCFTISIQLGAQKAQLSINRERESCTSLLKYSIERKYKELYFLKEQMIVDLIEGTGVTADIVDSTLPFLSKEAALFLISLEGSVYDAMGILKQLYQEDSAVTVLYRDNLLMVGSFEEVDEHARSIKESINSELYSSCYISYSNIKKGSCSLKEAYEDAMECMVIGKKYDLKDQVFNAESMILERAVYNISEKAKKEMLHRFEKKFSGFDHDTLTTIEEFIKCSLNISEAAKKLYIHRNTLIYRLDKIAKDTGYDIRNFKQAAIFNMAFLIWKESR